MSCDGGAELSVIVPVYNEENTLPPLFDTLSAQRGIRLELILCDGGSGDGTVKAAQRLAQRARFPVRLIPGEKGRGRQMNRGVTAATAPHLLFLHADSAFPDPCALQKALHFLAEAAAAQRETLLAGHFPLTFHFEGVTPLSYRYYQEKARLDRPGCTHGDQGILISRAFFAAVGPFREDLPLMEDTHLAERIREVGRWVLFPSEIVTSPRRFLSEGLLPRQTLNAVLMNLAALGRLELCRELRCSYRTQDATARLRLGDFLMPLARRVAALPWRERCTFWYRTGSYVRSNAWQIPFFLDLFCSGGLETRGKRFLALHDRLIEPLTCNRGGNAVATLLVWLWFRASLFVLRLARR